MIINFIIIIQMTMKKSVFGNAILNVIKQSCQIMFSLITIPYITRVLGVERYGTLNYSNSIVSYFVLLAALGINTYAIREGASMRKNRKQISDFASEIFSVNLLSMTLSYVFLFSMLLLDKFNPYRNIIIIQSLVIFFNTIGLDWINVLYEDYKYLTVRYVIIQGLAILAMLVFVRNPEDYLLYAFINVIASAGTNIFNFIHIKKYVSLKILFSKNTFKHLIPILILFANSIAITIYVNSDITMIGLIQSDYSVGMYSLASKIYSVSKLIITSIIVVTIPRISQMVSENEQLKYCSFFKKVYSGILVVTIPITVGIFTLSKPIMNIMGGNQYTDGYQALRWLSVAVLFSIIGYFFTNCVLIPFKCEKQVLAITLISAIANVGLNVFFIANFDYIGAAITTVLSEIIVAVMSYYYSKRRKFVGKLMQNRDLVSCLIGGVAVFCVCQIIQHMINRVLTIIVLSAVLSVMIYSIILILLSNSWATKICTKVKEQLKRKRKL